MIWTCSKCGREVAINNDLPVYCNCGSKSLPPYSKDDAGRRAWKLLHQYRPDVWSATESETWFRKTWMRQIPRYGCNCQSEFKKILEHIPPRFDTYDDFFSWTVDAHNAVNERLGRPILSLHEAKTIWHQKQQPG